MPFNTYSFIKQISWASLEGTVNLKKNYSVQTIDAKLLLKQAENFLVTISAFDYFVMMTPFYRPRPIAWFWTQRLENLEDKYTE